MADLVEIPRLDGPYLRWLSICGDILTKNKATIARVGALDEGRMTSRIPATKPTQYAQLFGGGLSKTHLHVNLLVPEPDWEPPNPAPLKALRTGVSDFLGESVELDLSGRFRLPAKALPKKGIIPNAMAKRNAAGLAVRQTAQRLMIEDSPVYELSWSLGDNGTNVYVSLKMKWETVINASYLIRCKGFVTDVFDLIVLGEVTDAAPRKK
jgi:hypothetical protein